MHGLVVPSYTSRASPHASSRHGIGRSEIPICELGSERTLFSPTRRGCTQRHRPCTRCRASAAAGGEASSNRVSAPPPTCLAVSPAPPMDEGRAARLPTAKADVRLESGPPSSPAPSRSTSTAPSSFSDNLWNTSSERAVRWQLGLPQLRARVFWRGFRVGRAQRLRFRATRLA